MRPLTGPTRGRGCGPCSLLTPLLAVTTIILIVAELYCTCDFFFLNFDYLNGLVDFYNLALWIVVAAVPYTILL